VQTEVEVHNRLGEAPHRIRPSFGSSSRRYVDALTVERGTIVASNGRSETYCASTALGQVDDLRLEQQWVGYW
jgi:hypothetical protein